MSFILGYGIVVDDMEVFCPRELIKLFAVDRKQEYKDFLDNLSNQELFDLLTYSEGIDIQDVLNKLTKGSNLVEYIYTGQNHAIGLKTKLPWEMTDSLLNISKKDVYDEIEYLIKPYIKGIIGFNCTAIYLNNA